MFRMGITSFSKLMLPACTVLQNATRTSGKSRPQITPIKKAVVVFLLLIDSVLCENRKKLDLAANYANYAN